MGFVSSVLICIILIALIIYVVDALNRMSNDIKAILGRLNEEKQ